MTAFNRAQMRERGKELRPYREEVRRLLDEDPNLQPAQLVEKLGMVGKLNTTTVSSWRTGHLRKRGLLAPLPRKEGKRQPKYVKPAITWEMVLNLVPDFHTLGQVLICGLADEMQKLKKIEAGETERYRTLEFRYQKLQEDYQHALNQLNRVIIRDDRGERITLDDVKEIILAAPETNKERP